MNIILSIIVPIYNVEPYLCRCIDSILAQTFTDFELILIDDGSPDRCGEIMEEYAKRDKRVITIHQENKGVSAARNAGLRIAQGTYVGFVDPDDWIDKTMYEAMILAMKSFSSDLVICPWCDCYPNGERVNRIANVKASLTQTELLCELFSVPRTIGHSCCNKLFKRKIIRFSYDESIKIREDSKFLCQYAINAHSACYITGVYYNAYVRKTSDLRTNPAIGALGLPVLKEMIGIISPLDRTIKSKAEAAFLDNCLLYINMTETDKASEYSKLCRNEFCRYMKRNFRKVMMNRELPIKLKAVLLLKILEISRG